MDITFFWFESIDIGKFPNPGPLPSITNRAVKNTLFPLPSLPEQQRIAPALSTIQRAIAAQDDLIAAAREVKRSLMERLFRYGPGAPCARANGTLAVHHPIYGKLGQGFGLWYTCPMPDCKSMA